MEVFAESTGSNIVQDIVAGLTTFFFLVSTVYFLVLTMFYWLAEKSDDDVELDSTSWANGMILFVTAGLSMIVITILLSVIRGI